MEGFGNFYLIMHTVGSLSSYASESETKTQANICKTRNNVLKPKVESTH